MHQYYVILRQENGYAKGIVVMADSHAQAKSRAEHQTGLCVLSTEFIN